MAALLRTAIAAFEHPAHQRITRAFQALALRVAYGNAKMFQTFWSNTPRRLDRFTFHKQIKRPHKEAFLFEYGAGERIRTADRLITNFNPTI